MNDRFKFRVFDKETGKYYESRINKCSGRTLYQHPSSGHCQWVTISTLFAELEQDEKIYTRTGVEPDTIIEQCTGLKDKNGKLIFEGDVVADGYVKRTVIWDGWYWNAKANTNCPLDNITCSVVEIIGNIHEQAEQKDK